MNKKINTFIFDCFGVICSPVYSGWYKENILKKGIIDEQIQNIFQSFDLGKLSEGGILDYFLKYEGINSTKEELRRDIDSYLNLDTKLAETILILKNKGFKTVLLSNDNASFFERKLYKKYPKFKSLFDEIIISSNIKMIKPNKDIYLYTLNKINSKPDESLFIENDQKNIDGAIKVGINSFLYTDSKSFINYINNLGINLYKK